MTTPTIKASTSAFKQDRAKKISQRAVAAARAQAEAMEGMRMVVMAPKGVPAQPAGELCPWARALAWVWV